MAFPVRFYSFNKRTNSTKIPGANDTSTNYQCVFKGPESILNPTIALTLPITQAPTWNYCRIDLFGRWYFVNDWRWTENRIWEADLTVDVLGTYRTAIGAKSYYVLRSATEYNPDVIDTFYPTEAAVQNGYEIKLLDDLWDGINASRQLVDFKLGTYVVGIVSNTADGHVMLGGVTYYVMPWQGMQQLVRNLITIWSGTSIAGVGVDAAKMLVDPFQYIYSVVWFPISMSRFDKSANTRPVQYGPFTFDTASVGNQAIYAYTLTEFDFCQSSTLTWTLPKHPQAASRGRFLKGAPFTSYSLFVPPFGLIPLDPAKFYDATSIYASVKVDPITGNGYLRIGRDSIAQGPQVDFRTAPVGVSIPMAQVTTDIIGGAKVIGDTASRTFGKLMTGNIPGAVGAAMSGIASAAETLAPNAEIKGGAGDFQALSFEVPYLRYQFQLLVDEDLYDNGRPLCENWQPSAIPGYMVIENGTTEITGTRDEAERIRDLLEGGFYYE